MGEADELFVARTDVIWRERPYPLDAKLLTSERPHDVAVDQRAAIDCRRERAAPRQAAGKVAQKAAREGVAGPRRVAHVFQRIGRGGEEAAVRAEEHGAVRALLDDQH